MHDAPVRRNGGIGFALSAPQATLTFTPSKAFEIIDRRRKALHDIEIASVLSDLTIAKATLDLETAFIVDIEGEFATHVGMGSGTSIRLACIEGLLALNGVDLQQEEIVRLSARGGTSGIGINTYFDGGLIFDLGVKDDGAGYAPSDVIRPQALPLTLPRLALPRWEISLFIPRSIAAKSQQEEAEFFRRVLPLRPDASHRACYEALFGVYASIREQDESAFATSIMRMQDTDWKAREWLEYGPPLTRLRDSIHDLGAEYVGMSSLGPMLFAGGTPEFLLDVVAAGDALDCDVIVTRMSNAGRTKDVSPCAP